MIIQYCSYECARVDLPSKPFHSVLLRASNWQGPLYMQTWHWGWILAQPLPNALPCGNLIWNLPCGNSCRLDLPPRASAQPPTLRAASLVLAVEALVGRSSPFHRGCVQVTVPVHSDRALGQQALRPHCIAPKVPLLLDDSGVQGCQGVAGTGLVACADGAARLVLGSVPHHSLPSNTTKKIQ